MTRRLAGMTAIVTRIEAEGRLRPGWNVDTAAAVIWMTTASTSYQALVVDLGWTAEAGPRQNSSSSASPHRLDPSSDRPASKSAAGRQREPAGLITAVSPPTW